MLRARTTLLLFAILTSLSTYAQTFEQIAFVRVNDTAPHDVRSAAMGGATDATAAEVGDLALNPALSASLKKPSFLAVASRNSLSVDARAWREGTSFTHAAAAFPVGRAVLGAYYATEPGLEGFAAGTNVFGTTPYTRPDCAVGCTYLFRDFNAIFSRDETRYGVTAAFEAGPVAFGAGAEVQQLDERAEVTRIGLPLVIQPTQSLERLFRKTSGREIVPNAGIRWRVSDRVALAAAYNGAGSFTRTTTACNTNETFYRGCDSAVAEIGSSQQEAPDAYRLGASVRPIDQLTFVAEAVRRNYGSLTDEQSSIIGLPLHLNYQDVTELHAGVEYRAKAVSLRAGWWRDPGRVTDFPQVLADSLDHYTLGAGVKVGPAQLELSYDESSDPIARRAMLAVRF